jgi:hypothetical protein
MPTFVRDSNTRPFANGGTARICGDVVQLPDLTVGIVESQRGIPANQTGMVNIQGQVEFTKASAATAFAAGARVAYHPTTKDCVPQVGAATAPAFIVGRVTVAAGAGVPTVIVDLNHQGPTI